MPKITRIAHVAIVVDNLETTLKFWRDTLGMEATATVDVPAEESLISFLPAGGSEIELIQPTTSDSGLTRFLEKRGPGIHHICLEVDDIEGMMASLKEKGIRLINETPLASGSGARYAFIHPKSANGVLVELYEFPRKV